MKRIPLKGFIFLYTVTVLLSLAFTKNGFAQNTTPSFLTVNPSNSPFFNVGQIQQFNVTGTYKDGSIRTLSPASSLAAGFGHSCVLLIDGTVQCWGSNTSGQLGNGTFNESLTPIAVSGLKAVVAIAAGAQHSCALLASGGVECWGSNANGQLGNGSTIAALTPVAVSGISSATAIVAGSQHTCALLASGAVQCWGANDKGQLGNGTSTASPVPVTVSGVSNVLAIAAGFEHSCALLASGAVQCWGSNSNGQLGNGTTSDSLKPVTVSGITSATAIAAGLQHSCAVLAAGGVQCWGSNSSGQLGNGSSSDSHVPEAVSAITHVIAIAAGGEHSCALVSSGGLQCWGSNSNGQLGNGTNSDSSIAVGVSGISIATAIAAGRNHSCAILSGGAIACWGLNNTGQLGDGTTGDSASPVSVSAIKGVIAIAAGSNHNCMVSTGRVECWGTNAHGQLGDGTTADSQVPVTVLGINDATAVAVGDDHSCALLSGGMVQCWGGNDWGQLGDSTDTDSATPVTVPGINNATAIAAGNTDAHYTCAVLSDGTVKCWGSLIIGLAGQPANSPPMIIAGLSGVTGISVGGGQVCALLSNGTVQCWGSNGYGELGNGTQTSSLTPVPVSGLTSATAISAGGIHTCAVLSSGAVQCWGSNYLGELGTGNFNGPQNCGNSLTGPVGCSRVPATVSGINTARSIASAFVHTCALLSSGSVMCWGQSGDGQLGHVTTARCFESVDCSPTPLPVLGLSGAATAIAAEGEVSDVGDSCALLSNGTVECWGGTMSGFSPGLVSGIIASSIVWTSSDTRSATVNANGVVGGLSPGNPDIMACLGGNCSDTTQLITDFSFSPIAPLSVSPGSTTPQSVTLVTRSGFFDNITLSVSGAPSGVTASLTPNSVYLGAFPVTSMLSVTVPATGAPSSFTLTITAQSESLTHSIDVTVNVTANNSGGGNGGGNGGGSGNGGGGGGNNPPPTELVVAAGQNNFPFAVIDFTNPSSPNVVNPNPGYSGGSAVDCSGTHAAVGNVIGGNVVIYDLSNPASPAKQGSLVTVLSGIGAIKVDGNRVLLGEMDGSRVVLIDISNPTSPQILSTLNTSISSISSVALSGSKAVVSGPNDIKIDVIDFTDPANPTQASFDPGVAGGLQGLAVDLDGNLAAVGSLNTSPIALVDIADVNAPSVLGTPVSSGLLGVAGPQTLSISIKGSQVAVGSSNFQKVALIDFTNPSNPVVSDFDPDSNVSSGWIVSHTPRLLAIGETNGFGVELFTLSGNSATFLGKANSNVASPSTMCMLEINANTTPLGSNVGVQPKDTSTGQSPVTVTFPGVTQAGQTTLTTSNSGQQPPDNFKLGNPAKYFDLTTTALFTPPATVCFSYAGVQYSDPSSIQLFHFANNSWVKITTFNDTVNQIVCGATNSFSPFALFEPSDTTPPTTTALMTPLPNAAGWNNQDVTITLSGVDNPGGSGVQTITYSISTNGGQPQATSINAASARFTISQEGTSTITFFAIDNSDNVETTHTLTVKLDKTPPSISGTRTPGANSNGWNNMNVTVHFSCSDFLSGVLPGSTTGDVTVSTEGLNQSVSGSCQDVAGNTASATATGINIDKTPPSINGSRTPAPNSNGWNNSNVTVSFTCADALSGLAAGSPPAAAVVSSEGVNQSVTGSCTDLAGNVASESVGSINIDKTPPTLACGANPSVLWPPNNKLVDVSTNVTVSDSLSGAAGFELLSLASNEPSDVEPDFVGWQIGAPSSSGQLRAQRLGSGTGRVYTLAYQGSDKAGNTAICAPTVRVPHDQGQP